MNTSCSNGQRFSLFPMASAIFIILFFCFRTVVAQQRQFNISLGSSLTPLARNSSWLSPSGLFAFGFYQQGNGYAVGVYVAGIPQKTVVWTANRDDPPVSSNTTLRFTNDGFLALQSTSGQQNDIVSASQPASWASISDTGNFVLYNSDGKTVWQSFEHPTDTLLQTQRIKAGTELVSSASKTDHSAGMFRLKMQGDGHLVQYPVGTPDTAEHAYWASGTAGTGDKVTLNLDPDGHLYLQNSTGLNIIKNLTDGGSPTEDTIYMMRVDVDGIFRLYLHNLSQNGNWSVEWSSTSNRCRPKGICGVNSYCVLNDQEPDCSCLPGFESIDQENWTTGCGKISAEGPPGSIRYIIQELPNTVWEDSSYSVLSLLRKEECEEACLKDRNCEAAFFGNSGCTKQKLPLRYGRRDGDNLSSALIKVAVPQSPTKEDGERPVKDKEKLSKQLVAIIGSVAGFGLLMSGILGVGFYRYHRWAYERISHNGNARLIVEVGPRPFSYAELDKVTDGFKVQIGRGSFGTVYKGTISSSHEDVAVKRLDRVLREGEREFQTEIKVIGKTHHRNLVRLLGYCVDGPNRLLVYEYMSNGSLADVLFSTKTRPSFPERMEFARSIARGILYLHEECETQIIHCDIKPQNILMDDFRCPKIADFGLAKLMKQDQTKTTTEPRGTRGYAAPEWHRNLPLTVKADVYSFGVVLLEIACCRRSVDQSLQDVEAILVDWVYQCFQDGEVHKLVGDEEQVDRRQLERMVKLGLWCTLEEPSIRPSMKKVLLILEGTVDIPSPPDPASFLSSI